MAPPIGHEVCNDFSSGRKKDHAPNQCSMCSKYGHLSKCCPEIKCYYCGKYGHSRKMCLNLYLHRVLKNQKDLQKMKMQMDAKLKFCKNEVYSPHNPITQAGLVLYGWKKKLKVDHPVDVSFMSVNCGKNKFSSLKFSNASFAIEPKDCPDKKDVINDGAKVYNIFAEKVANKSKLKEEEKTYKSCDNFHLHGTEAEYSNEGVNYETKKIKEDNYGGKYNKKAKKYDKKVNYERYEDLSSEWEEVEDDEIEEVKDFKKFKDKMMESYLTEGFKSIFNPNINKYENGYELDDEEKCEENEEKEEPLDKHINDFFEKMMKNKGSCGH